MTYHKRLLALAILVALLLTGCETASDFLFDEQPHPDDPERVLYTPKPAAEQTLQVARDLPFPFAATGATLLAAGLGIWGRKRSSDATRAEKLSKATVLGIEAFTNTPEGKKLAKHLKATAQQQAEKLGIADDLYRLVKQLTP